MIYFFVKVLKYSRYSQIVSLEKGKILCYKYGTQK